MNVIVQPEEKSRDKFSENYKCMVSFIHLNQLIPFLIPLNASKKINKIFAF